MRRSSRWSLGSQAPPSAGTSREGSFVKPRQSEGGSPGGSREGSFMVVGRGSGGGGSPKVGSVSFARGGSSIGSIDEEGGAASAELPPSLSSSAAPGRWESLHSGALHDAAALAPHLPSTMLFVPSINGISHTYDEDTSEADITAGAEVFAVAAARMLGYVEG